MLTHDLIRPYICCILKETGFQSTDFSAVETLTEMFESRMYIHGGFWLTLHTDYAIIRCFLISCLGDRSNQSTILRSCRSSRTFASGCNHGSSRFRYSNKWHGGICQSPRTLDFTTAGSVSSVKATDSSSCWYQTALASSYSQSSAPVPRSTCVYTNPGEYQELSSDINSWFCDFIGFYKQGGKDFLKLWKISS